MSYVRKENIHQELFNDQQKIEAVSRIKIPIYGKRLDPDNILGKHFKIQQMRRAYPDIALGTSNHEIPVFGEIKIHKPEEIKRPPTPDLIKKIRRQREEIKKSLEK